MGIRSFIKKLRSRNYYTDDLDIVSKSKQPKKNIEKAGKGIVEEADVYGIPGLTHRDIKRNLTTYDMWTYYLVNSWVRACVDKIIKEIVKHDVVVVPKTGVELTDEVREKIGKVQDLFANPNEKIESFDAIRRKYLRDILIYDAGAVEIVYGGITGKGQEKITGLRKQIVKLKKDKELLKGKSKVKVNDIIRRKQFELNQTMVQDGIPVELYDVKGPLVRFNVDKHGNFKEAEPAYKLVKHGQVEASFLVNELIYFVANPQAGSLYGLSSIETLVQEIESDNEASTFNTKILKHGGLISGVLCFPGMSKAKLKKNKLYWQEEIKRKGQKLIVTNNPGVSFIKLSENQRDMQFLEYQKWLLTKIMAVYGLQPIVLGVIDATTGKLNSKEQREQFYQDAILPLLKLEAHHFTDILINQGFGFDDIKISHEAPIDIDEEFNLKVFTEACKAGVIKVNEARELIGLPPLEGPEGEQLVTSRQVRAIKEVSEVEAEKSELSGLKERIRQILEPEITAEGPDVTDTEK